MRVLINLVSRRPAPATYSNPEARLVRALSFSPSPDTFVGAGLPAMAVYQPTLMLIDPPLSLASQLLQWDCVQHGDVVFAILHRIHRDTDIGHFDLLLADLAL